MKTDLSCDFLNVTYSSDFKNILFTRYPGTEWPFAYFAKIIHIFVSPACIPDFFAHQLSFIILYTISITKTQSNSIPCLIINQFLQNLLVLPIVSMADTTETLVDLIVILLNWRGKAPGETEGPSSLIY